MSFVQRNNHTFCSPQPCIHDRNKEPESCSPFSYFQHSQTTQMTTRWFWRRFAFGDSSLWFHDLGFLEWIYVFFVFFSADNHEINARQQIQIALMYVHATLFSEEWMLELLDMICFLSFSENINGTSTCNFSPFSARFLTPKMISSMDLHLCILGKLSDLAPQNVVQYRNPPQKSSKHTGLGIES